MTNTISHSNAGAGLVAKAGAVSAVLLLALSACGSDDSGDTSNGSDGSSATDANTETDVPTGDIYDFTHAPMTDTNVGPADEITVALPDDLLELAAERDDTDYIENRLFDHITVSAGDDPDSQCSVRVDYGYADGARELIEEETWYFAGYEDWIIGDSEEITRMTEDQLSVLGGGRDSMVLSDLDQDYRDAVAFLANSNTHYSGIDEDRSGATIPVSCASSPEANDKDTATVRFTWVSLDDDIDPDDVGSWADGGSTTVGGFQDYGNFATVEVWAMASGDVGIENSEVSDYYFAFNERLNTMDGWIPNGYGIDSQGNMIKMD